MHSKIIHDSRVFLFGLLLASAGLASAIAAEKQTFEAEAAIRTGEASKVTIAALAGVL